MGRMRDVAIRLGFSILYGDTDSLFVNNIKSVKDANNFVTRCKAELGVDVTHGEMFNKLILVGKKHCWNIIRLW
jgi:DNA polymerase elongation subunit (family B)